MRRDKSLAPLSHQHHKGLALCVLTRRALAGGRGADNVERRARRIVERHEIELTNHFAIEELERPGRVIDARAIRVCL